MNINTSVFRVMLLASGTLLGACAEEPPPRSVQDFVDNPQFLEAAVVRCSENRAESRYDAECVNARQAASQIEAREERKRREKLETVSQQKRDALRRTQRAAAEARRRAAELEALRKEAEYLAQFGESPEAETGRSEMDIVDNVPRVVIAAPEDGTAVSESQAGKPPPGIDDSDGAVAQQR